MLAKVANGTLLCVTEITESGSIYHYALLASWDAVQQKLHTHTLYSRHSRMLDVLASFLTACQSGKRGCGYITFHLMLSYVLSMPTFVFPCIL